MRNQDTFDTVIYSLATVVPSLHRVKLTCEISRLPIFGIHCTTLVNFLVSYFQSWTLEIVISENKAAFSKLIVMQIRIFPLL